MLQAPVSFQRDQHKPTQRIIGRKAVHDVQPIECPDAPNRDGFDKKLRINAAPEQRAGLSQFAADGFGDLDLAVERDPPPPIPAGKRLKADVRCVNDAEAPLAKTQCPYE